MKEVFSLIFENARVIVEAEAEYDDQNRLQLFNILITDKETGRSREAVELPDNLMAVATAVAEATPEDQ
jgi:hypothetical protein